MNPDELKQLFSTINIWTRRGERAPHKPLLLLHSLARLEQGEPRLQSYEQTREKLMQLLTEFGPARTTRAAYPFIVCRTTESGR